MKRLLTAMLAVVVLGAMLVPAASAQEVPAQTSQEPQGAVSTNLFAIQSISGVNDVLVTGYFRVVEANEGDTSTVYAQMELTSFGTEIGEGLIVALDTYLDTDNRDSEVYWSEPSTGRSFACSIVAAKDVNRARASFALRLDPARFSSVDYWAEITR